MNKSHTTSSLLDILHEDGTQVFDIIANSTEGATRKKSDVGRIVVNGTVTLKTIDAIRIFDGRPSRQGKDFVPGFHNLDKTLSTAVIPDYRKGNPYAKMFVLLLEQKVINLESIIGEHHSVISTELSTFMAQNPTLDLSSVTNEKPLVRNLSFRSPHVRDLVQKLTTYEKLVLLTRGFEVLSPKNKMEYDDVRKDVTRMFRGILSMHSHYKPTVATGLDFAENNARAQESAGLNSKYLTLPEEFLRNTEESLFLGAFPTNEELKKQRDIQFEAAMNGTDELPSSDETASEN